MPIAPNTPLPDFVHVGDVAKRWGVDTQYVMQFYGEAKFFIGMEPFREPYDRDTVLAQVKAEIKARGAPLATYQWA